LPARLWLWIITSYVFDLVLMPGLYLGSAVAFTLALQSAVQRPLWTILGWTAAFLLLQWIVGLFFASVHRDRPGTLKLLPLYGFYCTWFLNFAWIISALDEARNRRMNW
jgi:hypothetical protein